MKTKHQSINQESVNNVEVQDWWVQQALTIHIFWEKIKTSCSIDGTHSGGRDWDYVGDAGRHLRGWRHGHFHGSHHSYDLWSLVTISFLIIFSEKLFLVGDHYQFAGLFVLIWSMSSSFLRWPEKSHYIYINKCHSLANFIRKVNLSRL